MTPDPILKICGITRLEDARRALECGATALGFVFWPRSPRQIDPDEARTIVAALPAGVTTIGVFVNESVDRVREVIDSTKVSAVQLHGDEEPEDFASLPCPLVRATSLERLEDAARRWPSGTTWLLDASDPIRRGGTGTAIDWSRAAALARTHDVVLAGGLTPLNVDEAIRTVRPRGVDVSSGVEASPGVKDSAKLALFLTKARDAFAKLETRAS